MGKKARKTAISNTNQPKLEIDYDRLADTVAKAIVKEETQEREKYSMPREWMKFILYPMLVVMGVFMAILAAFSFYETIKAIPSIDWPFQSFIKALVRMLGFFVLAMFSSGVCITTFLANKELEKEKDRQYVASVLSNITSIVALVVALIALLKNAI